MDIKIVLRKSLVYTSMISLLTLLFFICIYIAERTFHRIVGYTSLMGSVAAITSGRLARCFACSTTNGLFIRNSACCGTVVV